MKYKKLSADCSNELFKKVFEACKKDKRTMANFVRVACEKMADKILRRKIKDE